jgi:UDP-N-acetylmuramoyl-L-alanyl-D-glutamate--2,6-diaminopimelate ligase
LGIVDYAHTPDALKNVLTTINEVCSDNEQVITVVGCGGDRDRTKRPLMARIATELEQSCGAHQRQSARRGTHGHPRRDAQGVQVTDQARVWVNADRREAIRQAVGMAKPGRCGAARWQGPRDLSGDQWGETRASTMRCTAGNP